MQIPSIQPLCKPCAVRQASSTGHLSRELREELRVISHLRAFRRGETVQAQGEEVPFVGNVLSGMLRIRTAIGNGRQRVVGLLLPSDFYGRAFTGPSTFSIGAASDSIVCCFERAALESLCERYPELGREWMDNRLDEVDAARDWLVLLDCASVTALIASFLLMLCRRAEACTLTPTGRLLVSIPTSRSDMSTYLGTTVETISRVMLKMSNLKIIRIHEPRHFEVLDEAGLMKISGHEELVRHNRVTLALTTDPAP